MEQKEQIHEGAEAQEVAAKTFWEHFPDWAKLVFGAIGLLITLTTIYVSTRTDISALKNGLTRIEQSLIQTSAENKLLQRELVKRVTTLEQQSKLQQMLIGGLERLRTTQSSQQQQINELRIEQIRLKTQLEGIARPQKP